MMITGTPRVTIPSDCDIEMTRVFDAPRNLEAVGTLSLVESGGKTTLTLSVRYQSREARDAVLKTPAAQGVSAGYDRLAELLPTLAAEVNP
jgi:hypothetical protein